MPARLKQYQHLLALVICTICESSLPAQSSTLQDSLVAWYKFDGSALDASGNNNHGTLFGGSYTTDRFGNPNKAIFLDGIDDYVSYVPNQKFKPQLPVTIAAWINVQDLGTNMIFQNDYTENVYNGVSMTINPGVLAGGFTDGGPAGAVSRRTKSGFTPINTNQWYHVAIIIRGALDMTLYINGKEECGFYSGNGGPLQYSGSPGASGVSDGNIFLPPDFYHGKIDDIRFYSRELGVSEIAALQDLQPGSTNQDTLICAGQSVTLDGGTAATYAWSPAAGLSCTNCQNPVASPSSTSTYQVITNAATGCPDTLEIEVAVQNCNPCDTANLSASFGYSTNFLTVSFFNLGSGAATTLWNFGDGNTALWPLGTPLTHNYAQPGSYTVCQSLQQSLGSVLCADTFCQTITVTSPCAATPLSAAFSYITNGLTVNFNDLSTGGVTSVWSFGDNTTVQGATGTGVSHTYSQAGSYSACLIVQAPGGGGTLCADTICYVIDLIGNCSSPALLASFSYTQANSQITCTDLTTGAPTSLSWDFGDGTLQSSAPGASASHAYGAPGNYTLCLTAKRQQAGGLVCSDSFCLNIQVDSVAPCDTVQMSANFSWSATGFQVQFVDLSTGGNINSLLWEFGDGSVASSAPGVSLTHSYSSSGPFQACLYVYRNLTDKIVCRDTLCQVLDIRTSLGSDRLPGLEAYLSQGQLHIQSLGGALPQFPLSVSLWSLTGAQLGTLHTVHTLPITLQLPWLAPGMYFIRVENEAGFLVRKWAGQ